VADELIVRRAVLADVAGIARVHVQSWHATYPGILPAAEIERHTLAQRAGTWARLLDGTDAVVFVAARDEAVQGFANTGRFRLGDDKGEGPGEGQGEGELNVLYVLPTAQRQGIGRSLFNAGANALRESGFSAMRCWVLHGNPAVAFYERLGGERVASKTFTVEGATVAEHCYRFRLG
jgi:ribosomal protein S18 acetylase RimI-like enzyme